MKPDQISTTVNQTDSTAEIMKTSAMGEEIDRQYMHEPLPASVLKLLLDRLGISVQAGALRSVCDKVQQGKSDLTPTQRLNFIFHALEIKGVQVAQLRWSRFDQRRLPAMIYHEQSWKLIERSEAGKLQLTDGDGSKVVYHDGDFADGIVLWFQARQRANKAGRLVKGNLAAQLILRRSSGQSGG